MLLYYLVKFKNPKMLLTLTAPQQRAVAVLGFSFFLWGGTGVAKLSSGVYTTNTFVLNYRICNRLYQIINIETQANSLVNM